MPSGGEARLECLASGRPPPTVVWLHEQERRFLLPGDSAGQVRVDPVTGELVRRILNFEFYI